MCRKLVSAIGYLVELKPVHSYWGKKLLYVLSDPIIGSGNLT